MQVAASTAAPAASGNVTTTVDSIVAGVRNLLSMPATAVQLGALLSDPRATTTEIAEIVGIDPSLSARVLRIASSAYFGVRAPIETISQAVTVIGLSNLHLLTLATSASEAFNKIPSEMVNLNVFWRHSVGAALAAGSLAARGMRRHRERIFLAALLHDVGQIVIYHQLPEVAVRVLEAMARGETRQYAEHALLGFSHAEVGAALLDLWKLPESLTEPVRYHDRWVDAPNHGAEAAIVHLSSTIAHHMESGRDKNAAHNAGLPDVNDAVWAMVGRHPDELDEVIAEVNTSWGEVMNLIAPASMIAP